MTIISLIEQEWSILGDPGAVSWIGRKGGTYLKTFVPPFLPTRLTAPGMGLRGWEWREVFNNFCIQSISLMRLIHNWGLGQVMIIL